VQSLIAFDPGQTTGWCRFQHTLNTPWRVVEFGQFPLEEIQVVYELILPAETVVYEQIQMLHLGFDPVGLQVIGAIKLTCALQENTLIGQSPGNISGAKLWPDLEDARKWFVRQQHAKDAFYHGITRLGLKAVDLTKSPRRSS